MNTTITPTQCRAARGLLGLTQAEFADAAKVSLETLRDFEAGRDEQNRCQIAQRSNRVGIEFTGEGVRWALPPLAPEESSDHIATPRLSGRLRGEGGPMDNPEHAAANRAASRARHFRQPVRCLHLPRPRPGQGDCNMRVLIAVAAVLSASLAMALPAEARQQKQARSRDYATSRVHKSDYYYGNRARDDAHDCVRAQSLDPGGNYKLSMLGASRLGAEGTPLIGADWIKDRSRRRSLEVAHTTAATAPRKPSGGRPGLDHQKGITANRKSSRAANVGPHGAFYRRSRSLPS